MKHLNINFRKNESITVIMVRLHNTELGNLTFKRDCVESKITIIV